MADCQLQQGQSTHLCWGRHNLRIAAPQHHQWLAFAILQDPLIAGPSVDTATD